MIKTKFVFGIFCLSALLSSCTAIVPEQANRKWVKTDNSVALTENDTVIWQFNYRDDKAKPFFHPLSLTDGTVLTEAWPDDHPWHHALWFSWKYINGVNFWEEDRKTGKSKGQTKWSNVKVTTAKDNSAKIEMDLTYNHTGQAPILSEKRSIYVSPPDNQGGYYIDFVSKFHAYSEMDVKLDRTPLPDEKNGQPWGGYAGLSVRLNGSGKNWAVTTEKQKFELTDQCLRTKAMSMDYSGTFNGTGAGIAIIASPKNINSPSPWYVYENNEMKFFSPAVICNKPFTLQTGKKFKLSYRIFVHPGYWTAENLNLKIKEP